VTYLFVEPGELHGRYVPDKIGNGPANVRRQGVAGRQQGQERWDDTDLTRRSDLPEAGDPVVLAAKAV
jgi:hypothetical protein